MKRIALAIAGTVLLSACGHDTRTPVALGTLVVPNQAPWLILSPGPEQVELRGLDDTLKFLPDPPLAKALEAQLRAGVQQDYFANLTIACDDIKAGMKVDTDEAPDTVLLDLSLRCTINAAGRVSSHAYAVSPTTPVPAGSSEATYAQALGVLLRKGAGQIATQLSTDVRASRPTAP
jgi:hypothetical protein